MSTSAIKTEPSPQDLTEFDGRGLTAEIVSREVFLTCDPLGIENKLVLGIGLLACKSSENTSRILIGVKSPLTGGIKESNADGDFASKKNLGYTNDQHVKDVVFSKKCGLSVVDMAKNNWVY